MTTNYEYITLQDTSVWWGLLWVPGALFGLSVLITILYTIFAVKRTSDGYLYRFGIPMVVILAIFIFIVVPLAMIDSNSQRDQKNEQLGEIFPKASYEGDNQFTATTKDDVEVRGTLIQTDKDNKHRYAVVYVPIEVTSE